MHTEKPPGEDAGRGHLQAKERCLGKTKPANTMISDIHPSESWEHTFLLSKPPGLWWFVMAALADMLRRNTGMPCFLALHTLTVLFFVVFFFTNWRFVATLHPASLSAPFFRWHSLTSCPILVILTIFLFHYYCDDLWSVIKTQKARWWLAFFSKKVFLN